MQPSLIRFSKFLSLILRHNPEKIGLKLDEHGWAEVDELLLKAKRAGMPLTRDLLDQVVDENDKQRFAFSVDRLKIRANQGHTIKIDLELQSSEPPEFLYHGTASRFLESIRKRGILPGKRNHVHLSSDVATAKKVGSRHGKPIILTIKARKMHRAGYSFYLSENHVWLTEAVPATFIILPTANSQEDGS